MRLNYKLKLKSFQRTEKTKSDNEEMLGKEIPPFSAQSCFRKSNDHRCNFLT